MQRKQKWLFCLLHILSRHGHMTWLLIHPNKAVRNLGVIFGDTMNMEGHEDKMCQTAFIPFIHLRNILKIRHYITKDACESVVHVFITSILNSVNAVLYGLPKLLIEKLQCVQIFSARLITGSYNHDHITPVLKSLLWLPVEQRIRGKITVLGFKCVHHPKKY